MQGKKLLVTLGGVLLLSGCNSYLTMQSTRTVDPGQVEFTGAVGKVFTTGGAFGGLGGGIFGPTEMEGAVRFGLVKNLDFGLRLNLADLGVSAGAKLRFINSEKFQMAVLGAVGTSLWAPLFNLLSKAFIADKNISAFLYWVDAGLLAGIPMGTDGSMLLTFGPKFKLTNYSLNNLSEVFGGTGGTGSTSVSSTQISPGVMLGLEFSLDNHIKLLPEIDIHYDVGGRTMIFQVGFSGTFGSGSSKASSKKKGMRNTAPPRAEPAASGPDTLSAPPPPPSVDP